MKTVLMRIFATANKSMKIIQTVFVLILLLCCGTSCRKKNDSGVPLVPVDLYLYASDPQFVNISFVGGWEYIAGGSRGVLLYRKSSDEFQAYDRHCTFNVDEGCRVAVDSSSILVTDELCCGSVFLLTDGSVTNGPASYSLHRYNTTFDGSVLHIYN